MNASFLFDKNFQLGNARSKESQRRCLEDEPALIHKPLGPWLLSLSAFCKSGSHNPVKTQYQIAATVSHSLNTISTQKLAVSANHIHGTAAFRPGQSRLYKPDRSHNPFEHLPEFVELGGSASDPRHSRLRLWL